MTAASPDIAMDEDSIPDRRDARTPRYRHVDGASPPDPAMTTAPRDIGMWTAPRPTTRAMTTAPRDIGMWTAPRPLTPAMTGVVAVR